MNIFSFFENRDETLLPSIIVYYLVFNFITQKHFLWLRESLLSRLRRQSEYPERLDYVDRSTHLASDERLLTRINKAPEALFYRQY